MVFTLWAYALAEVDADVGDAVTGWAAELSDFRDLVVRTYDPSGQLGSPIAVEVEGHEAVESLAGGGVDQTKIEAAEATFGQRDDLAGDEVDRTCAPALGCLLALTHSWARAADEMRRLARAPATTARNRRRIARYLLRGA